MVAQPAVGLAQSAMELAQPAMGLAQPAMGLAKPAIGLAQSQLDFWIWDSFRFGIEIGSRGNGIRTRAWQY